jgi:hypothetical protein
MSITNMVMMHNFDSIPDKFNVDIYNFILHSDMPIAGLTIPWL